MDPTPDSRIPEEAAALIWRRAAELQARAAQQGESLALTHAAGEDPAAGYRLAEVEAAAREAGISAEFVRAAVEEYRVGAVAPGGELSPAMRRAVKVALGVEPGVLEVEREIDASAERVYASVQRLFPNHPFHLVLRDIAGDDPTRGAALVFDVGTLEHADDVFYNDFGALGAAYVLRIFPDATRPDRCRVTLSTDLRARLRTGVWIEGWSWALGTVPLAILMSIVGLESAAVTASEALGTLGILSGGWGALMAGGFRLVYPWRYRFERKALDRALSLLAVDVRTGGVFARSEPDDREGKVFGLL